ncbi:hypothetical protein BU25DRAFT_425377 [Macroventuria anomochaeta]|uniref:Uncharacterized protein n=1 Tax=Macroventuria anomochaeta TaxID=301207 RepID=A0ACB6RNC0_9PLEO|nr:uncharacterized protein BU25DRAFT_425377 [Macroventuria anomochaeta]KAF2622900.1 hypothetical protein BU25DRAFT_425377 [Macroventuria anomochaeta]
MAVLSTMQPIPTEIDSATIHMAQPIDQDFGKQHIAPRSSALITFMTPVIDLSLDTLPSTPSLHEITANTSSFIIADNHMDHQHGSAPSDGETVWYCSNCGNGPMGTWYTACPCCNHPYCSACTVEQN